MRVRASRTYLLQCIQPVTPAAARLLVHLLVRRRQSLRSSCVPPALAGGIDQRDSAVVMSIIRLPITIEA